MSEQTAIITGAGGGIGRATAGELARLGFRVVLAGRTEATLQETDRLINVPGRTLIVRGDVACPEHAQNIVTRTLERFGRIDVLVNSAGTAPLRDVEQTTPQLWRDVIETNLSGVFYLCRACWPTFRRQQGGVIVNISSMAARDPFGGFVAYGAAKAGLNNLGLSLAREGAAIGVRVHTIAPGAVETAMFRSILSPEQFPVENTLSPADVARVVAECAMPDGALRYTSGQVIWLNKRP
ncbi:SDR family NAD(P)-dependent oxidoreductase [Fontivita pretiosa]|uniref:SDR family NAD(P)-dependent oxidoreductase n=1 Tax=Fontivita pretiosa TaxID=2989684 RepID=UPI003D165E47